jgi:hypothetical protein
VNKKYYKLYLPINPMLNDGIEKNKNKEWTKK